jgi:hypothetical protein
MIYVVQQYKSIPDAPRRLAELEEQRHILLSVRCEDGQCIAKFPNGEFIFPLEMCEELEPLVGREIAILRLEGRYHIQDVGKVSRGGC